MLRQAHGRMLRGQGMATFDPGFCRQAFQVEPDRLLAALRHGKDVSGWNIAAEKFNDDVRNFRWRKNAILIAPVLHRHSSDLLLLGGDGDFRANTLKAM